MDTLKLLMEQQIENQVYSLWESLPVIPEIKRMPVR